MKRIPYTLLLSMLFFGLYYSGMNSQEETYSKVAVDINDTSVIQQLVELGMAIDHFEYNKDNSISFYVTQNELQTLTNERISFNIEIDDYAIFYNEQSELDQKNLTNIVRGSEVANGFDLGSMGGFYTFDEVVEKLDEMKLNFPNLITTKESIGISMEGRNIWMVKISDNPAIDEDEPVAYFDALHHAREPLAMAVTINYMFWLLEHYETDEQVKYMIDHRELYFVPVVNPDGYEFNKETNPNGGGLWRKNRNPNDGTCIGVDLNRNYSFAYANDNSCSSPDPCSGIYRGDGPFSELETTAIRDFMTLISPKTAFSTHSTAGSYLMPYGFDTSPPEFGIYSEWASAFLSKNDYPYGVTYQMLGYTSCGTTRDFLHSEGIYGWTPEIDGSGFWPPQSTIFDLVDENVYPLFYQSWIAGAFVDIQSHQLIGNAIPGEAFSLIVEAKNVGVGAIADNVTIMVEASTTGITISEPVNYGAIDIRTRVNNENQPFIITVDTDFEETSFDLKVTIFQDGVLNDELEIPVFIGEKEVLYFDDAESGASNWSATGNGILWSVVSDDAYSGTSCFGDSNGGNGMNNTINYFELNENFDLSETHSPFVSFIAKHSIEEEDIVNFQLSIDEGANWETLLEFTKNETWLPYSVNLQQYAEETSVIFRFMMVTDTFIPADGFYFDDFELVNYNEKILGTEISYTETEWMIYPNPFTNKITVENPFQNSLESIKLSFFDILGKTLSVNVVSQNGKFIISNLDTISKGVYFLKIYDDRDFVKIYKIMKR